MHDLNLRLTPSWHYPSAIAERKERACEHLPGVEPEASALWVYLSFIFCRFLLVDLGHSWHLVTVIHFEERRSLFPDLD